MLERGDTFSFDRLLHKYPVVLAFFYSESCSKCKALLPVMKDIGQTNDKVCVIEINTNRDADFAYNYAVSAVPSLLLFKDGTYVDRKTGAQNRKAIEKFIDSVL